MVSLVKRKAFSITDLLIMIAVLGILVALLLPALSTVRESARRSTCTANLKQIALAILTFDESYKHYPPSAFRRTATGDAFIGEADDDKTVASDLVPASAGKTGTAAPFSMFVKLLPYMEFNHIFENLDWDDSAFDPNSNNVDFADDVIPGLVCPSYDGVRIITQKPYNRVNAAITNYKAYGATDAKTLDNPKLVKADTATSADGSGDGGGMHHPYGVVRAPKATSLTFLSNETREEVLASWYDGTAIALCGIVDDEDPRVGLNNAWGPDPSKFAYQKYADKYAMEWGPSSEHPGVTVHSFADGSARGISNDIPIKVYRPLITRAANDNAQIGRWLAQ
ncbi:MAG: DUF1559 domain-containing protein [Planctomycetales bacterium]